MMDCFFSLTVFEDIKKERYSFRKESFVSYRPKKRFILLSANRRVTGRKDRRFSLLLSLILFHCVRDDGNRDGYTSGKFCPIIELFSSGRARGQ